MESRIPDHHPLRRLFGALTERSFTEKLRWPDFNVTEYVSNLLVEFTHADSLYRLSAHHGERLDSVVEMLYESEVLWQANSLERELEVHRHIGDFTLFMTGLFPEYLRRLKSASMIYHKDFLVDYVKTGKRSYGIVAQSGSQMDEPDSRDQGQLFRKLSENFELCVTGLGFVRTDLDRMQDPTYRSARDILLN
jgi:hypothetical protein